MLPLLRAVAKFCSTNKLFKSDYLGIQHKEKTKLIVKQQFDLLEILRPFRTIVVLENNDKKNIKRLNVV